MRLMTRSLMIAWLFAGCYSNNPVGNDSVTVGKQDGGGGDAKASTSATSSSVNLSIDIDGMTVPAGCTNGATGLGFSQGATCGSAGIGDGPVFQRLACNSSSSFPSQSVSPNYMVAVYFRNYPSTGMVPGTTFDLSDPGHEQFITVAMGYSPQYPGNEFEYCSAAPQDLADGGTYPVSSGIVTVNQFGPPTSGDQAQQLGLSDFDIQLSNVVVPSKNGGPKMRVVSAHLFSQF